MGFLFVCFLFVCRCLLFVFVFLLHRFVLQMGVIHIGRYSDIGEPESTHFPVLSLGIMRKFFY